MTELEKLVQSAEHAAEAFVCDPNAQAFVSYSEAVHLARREFERRISETYADFEAALARK